ncbi:MAG: HAMP domain-containing sensor histidine kinase, partial [Pseudomonadota bacterium]
MAKSHQSKPRPHTLPAPGESEQDAAWARAEAQAATFDLDQQKARFLAMVSHEIRTPLNGIIGMGKLLTDTKLTAEQRNYVDAMTSSSQALLLLVNDLLEFGQQRGTARRQEIEHLDIRNCIAGVTELLAGRAHEKGIDLGWRVTRCVPDIVCVNAVALRQVLFNIIGNAVKFTENGGVSVTASFCDERLEIRVSDTGPGISDADKASVFDPFHQLDMTHTRANEGAGLGLAITKRLVEDMGGEVALKDSDSGGAQFDVRLPAQAVPAVFEASPTKRSQHHNVHLAMDDGPEKRLLAAMLEDAGVTVCDGDAANTVFLDMRRADAERENDAVTYWTDRAKAIAYLIEPQQRGTFGAEAKANGHSYLTRPVREASLL